ncbi:hypothetical protein ABPG75_008850 [Micractinium tetrahymenae]
MGPRIALSPVGGRRASRPLCTPPAAGPPRVDAASAPALPPAPQLSAEESEESIVGWNWTGSDEFTPLGDRKDARPLPLPRLKHSKRVVLVRHGQSTWNARNRIQGSSNFSVLTEMGRSQAHAAQALLASWEFECLFVSPLKRAVETSEIVWGRRRAPRLTLPSLREIDLYTFQGLDKLENRSLYPEQYANWQNNPAEFTIDGHAPVRELWYRASLAWREILYAKPLRSCGLVVAHNAVNQALLCTALGLPPAFFRRFAQSNAAFTVLDFDYAGGPRSEGGQRQALPPRVRVERMNQFPDRPMTPTKLGKSVPNRLVMVCGEATSPAVQASLNMLAGNGVSTPPLIGVGSTAQQVLDVKTAVQAALATPGDGRSVIAVVSAEACQHLLGECLGPAELAPQQAEQGGEQQGGQQLGPSAVGSLFHMSEGGVTIVNWPQSQRELTRGTVLCTNYQLPVKLAGEAAEEADA